MVLSQRFYDQLTKLEQMGEWTKLPDDHPDIKMLQLYADLDDKDKAAGRRKVARGDSRYCKGFEVRYLGGN